MPLSQSVSVKIQKSSMKSKLPALASGMTVRVHQKIKEGGKERVQIYEGLIIKKGSGTGAEKTMMVRKIVDGIGVEKIFPIHSSNIKKIDVVKLGKVRRAKLYYMRNLSGKSARLKEKYLNLMGVDEVEELKKQAEKEEAAKKAEEEKKTEETKSEEAKV